MEVEQALYVGNKILKQRNLFLFLVVIQAVAIVSLSIKMLSQEEKIIMVPPLTSEVTISNHKVSSGYIEQMSMVFLNALLDLSASDVMHKRDLILKYTVADDAGFTKQLNEYFANIKEQYEKFDLVTYFTIKNIEINDGADEVIAHGILTSRYGKRGFNTDKVSYKLGFEFSGGYLRLKKFNKIEVKDD